MLRDKRLRDLVGQNGVYAYALYHLGIKFYEYSEQTLEQACTEQGISLDTVLNELESPMRKLQPANVSADQLPIDLMVAYLKHTHLLFVKYKLPYIASLIDSLQAINEDEKNIEKDLKMIFPLFIEDFIHHIHEEEDTLFYYINLLHQATKNLTNAAQLYYIMERHSMRQYAKEHEMHSPEIMGLRGITKVYACPNNWSLHMKVLYRELEELEDSLVMHARIENEILMPKAVLLEDQIRQRLQNQRLLN